MPGIEDIDPVDLIEEDDVAQAPTEPGAHDEEPEEGEA